MIVNVFEFRDDYAFSHYFDGGEVFREISDYYLDEEYRFEVRPRTSRRSGRRWPTTATTSR